MAELTVEKGKVVKCSSDADLGLIVYNSAGGLVYDSSDCPSFTRNQIGTQATTNVLTVLGAAIEHATKPFNATALISLHNMQAGDTFLVTCELRDQNDATYREYDRKTYAGVQVSPMVHVLPVMCQGWRMKIQRTAGSDRDVTYQFFKEQ